MKPKHITLSSNFLSACMSADGSLLFVFQQSAEFLDKKSVFHLLLKKAKLH